MSLINKMLLDLEARKDAPSVHGAKVVLDDLRPIMGARNAARPRGPMVLAGLATVAVALAGMWYWQNTTLVTPPPAAQAPMSPSVTQPNAIAPVTSPTVVAPAPAAVLTATESLPTPVPAPATSAPSISVASAPAVPVPETNIPAAPPSAIVTAPPAVIAPMPAPPAAAVDAKPKPKRALPVPAVRVAAAAPPNESAESAAAPALIDKTPRVLSPADQADQYYRNALSELKQRRTQAAEADLRAALQQQPAHLKARELAVALMVQRGRAAEAVTILQQGLEVAPKHAPFAHWLARIYADQAQDTKAVAVLETARQQSAGDADIAGLLATLYQRGARHGDAIVSYRAALAVKPSEARWWTGLGISLEAERQWRDAAQAYGRARETGTLTPALARYIDERLQSLNARRD